jgi:hypothetical protein
MISKGRVEIANTPLLSTHRGIQPDLVLRWNEMSEQPTSVDVVVHLHGYSDKEEAMSLPGEKEPISGLDFFDPDRPDVSSGRSRATLCILPRGNWVKKRQYDFPALTTSDGLSRLIDFSLEYFGTRIGVSGLKRNRFLLTAHSGGGRALLSVLSHVDVDPDELHVFDALYWSAEHLVTWARRHIQADAATITGGGSPNGALRVFYLPGMGTEDQSVAVLSKIASDISAHPGQGNLLTRFYRVEKTTVAHLQIPRRLGWQLLRSAGADIAREISPQRHREHEGL